MESVKKGSDAMGPWQVYRHKARMYQVYRMIQGTDIETGNSQWAYPIFDNEAEAEAFAKELNNEEQEDE